VHFKRSRQIGPYYASKVIGCFIIIRKIYRAPLTGASSGAVEYSVNRLHRKNNSNMVKTEKDETE